MVTYVPHSSRPPLRLLPVHEADEVMQKLNLRKKLRPQQHLLVNQREKPKLHLSKRALILVMLNEVRTILF